MGHKKNLRKSCNRLQNFVSLHADGTEKHFLGVACNVGRGKQDSASEPIKLR